MDRWRAFGFGAVGATLAGVLLAGGLWLATADTRAALARLDALLNPPELIRPDSAVILRDVRSLARLETARVSLEQRLVGQRGTDTSWIWLGERMELVARGEAVAGVDLTKLGEHGVRVEADGAVVIRLPPAELWDVHLDEQGTFVAARERGWLGWQDADLESRVRREAVGSLREAALRTGILERANTQARAAVGDLLGRSGVSVRFE